MIDRRTAGFSERKTNIIRGVFVVLSVGNASRDRRFQKLSETAVSVSVPVPRNLKKPVPVRFLKYCIESEPLSHQTDAKVFASVSKNFDFLVFEIKGTAHFII